MKEGGKGRRHRKGSGYIRRRGRIYYITYWVGGKSHEESCRSTKLEDAQKLLRERLMGTGAAPAHGAKGILVNELLNDLERDYLLNRRRSIGDMLHSGLKRLRPHWASRSAAAVTTEGVTEYQLKRRAEGAADATINREVALLRRAFNLARQSTPPKIASAPYFPTLKERNVRSGFLEPDQYARLRDALPQHLKALFVVAYHVGCRRGELLGRRGLLSPLKWEQVDLLHDQIVLKPGTTKNDEGRVLPIYGEMKPWLVMLREQRDSFFPQCPWVFHRNGEPIKDFRGAWKSACKAAGVPELLFHDLRRSAVRNMRKAGLDRKRAMTISGHKTETTFERYNITSDRDRQEDVAKLEAYMRAQLTPAPQTEAPPEAKKTPLQ